MTSGPAILSLIGFVLLTASTCVPYPDDSAQEVCRKGDEWKQGTEQNVVAYCSMAAFSRARQTGQTNPPRSSDLNDVFLSLCAAWVVAHENCGKKSNRTRIKAAAI